MDALKKAEAGQARADAGAGNSELSLEPLSAPRSTRTPAADPPAADLAAPGATRRADAAAAQDAAARAAVRGVFAAKQAPARPPLARFVAAAALAGLLIGAYFWWQLQAGKPSLLAPGSAAAPSPAPTSTAPASTARADANAAPAAPPLPSLAATANAPNAADSRASAATTAETPPLTRPRTPANAPADPQATPPARAAAAAESAAALPAPAARRAATRAPAPAGTGEPALQLNSSANKRETPLQQGYQAMQEGRFDEAQRHYAQALQGDPRNVDALLGLALIANRQGRSAQAESLYLRALEANPADPDAQAGLINLRGPGDPLQAESRLKTLLASQPESAALHFALGNLLARQDRWAEAQQAYFRAWATAPDNADILYNLAVSLDHLRQNKLAAQHYRLALDAATRHPATFERAAVERRLAELQP